MRSARLQKPGALSSTTVQARAASASRAENRTGLPAGLKTGLEALSGLSMDAVRVHYGSAQPAQINALAYADGTDIHLAPGQERHLPHEAWHVVQQAEGRVSPTTRIGGTAVNDDAGLEHEADRMGDASANYARGLSSAGPRPAVPVAAPAGGIVQGVFEIKAGALKGTYKGKQTSGTNKLIDTTRDEIGDEITGWIGSVRDWAGKDEGPYEFADTDAYYDHLREHFGKVEKEGKVRPNFSSGAYKLGKIAYGIETGQDEMDMKPSEKDLAMPHRFPFGGIKRSTELFLNGTEDGDDLDRWSSRLEVASRKRLKINEPLITKKKHQTYYRKEVEGQIEALRRSRKRLKAAKKKGTTLTLLSTETQDFLKAANNMHGNIPGFGPHTKINIPVRDRLHFNFVIPDNWDQTTKVPMSPGSEQASLMSPHRSDIALDSTGKYVPSTFGDMISTSLIEGFEDLDQYGSMTTIDPKKFKRFG